MTDTAQPQDAAPATKPGRLPLLAGLAAALALGGAGFFAAYKGYVPAISEAGHGEDHGTGALPDVAFVKIEPMILSLGQNGGSQHLKFGAELEVAKPYAAEVTLLLPRILDVLNGYLRAVSMAELEDPSALVRLRARVAGLY